MPDKFIEVKDRDALRQLAKDLHTRALDARTCVIEIPGQLGQFVSQAYRELYKVRALRERREIVIFGEFVGAINDTAKFNPGSLYKQIGKRIGDLAYEEAMFLSALTGPHATVVCSIMVAGLNLALNDGDKMVLSAEGHSCLPPRP